MKSLGLLLVVAPLSLIANEAPDRISKRIYSHLVIHDYESALEEARGALIQYPESDLLEIAYMDALCQKGEEIAAYQEWKRVAHRFEGKPQKRHILESLAWGVLHKADHSQQWLVRLFSLIGATLTHDVRAIPLMMDALRDSNAILRRAAIEFSMQLGDECLRSELLRLLKEEKAWHVRQSVIRAVGQLKLVEGNEVLKEIILSSKATAEEKYTAMTALVMMSEEISVAQLKQLIVSQRAGMRELACQLVAHLQAHEHAELLIPLLSDSSPSVRQSALNCFGLLATEKALSENAKKAIANSLKDVSAEVAITGAWVMAILEDEQGMKLLGEWLKHSSSEHRRLAAASISKLGSRGVALAKEAIKTADDHFVAVSLAMALIGQRQEVAFACETISTFLNREDQTLLMWEEGVNSLFPYLAPTKLTHQPQVAHYPYVVDQMVRLELLSILGMLEYPKALDAVKAFLSHQNTEVIGMAATTLMERGDEEAMKLVRALLDDPNDKIRFSAALTLALFGKDPASIRILEEAYETLPREEKLHILEALGHIGDPASIPFFVKQLEQPYQTLRVAAASSLIRCLYH